MGDKGDGIHSEEFGSDVEVSSILNPDEVKDEIVIATKKNWPQLLASLTCLLCALMGLVAAACGFFLILYTLLTRSYIPAKAHLAKELYFDYTDSTAIATADFTSTLSALGRAREGIQAFPTGSKLTIWMELEAAETHSNMNADMFQVLAQILSSNGEVAASVSRPCILTAWSPIVQFVRNIVSAPAVLLGLWREHQVLHVPLFSKYPDQPDRPLQSFKAILKATGPNAQLPHLYSAKVHIKLALGLIGRIFYWFRPGAWNTLALILASGSTIVGGLLTTVISLFVWLSIGPKSHAPPHQPPLSDDEGEDAEDKNPGLSRESSYSELSESEVQPTTAPKHAGKETITKTKEMLLEDSLPSVPQISHEQSRRWGMFAS